EALRYPRPVQERIPILIGGSGERKTLRLVARYADACNLFGDAATVRHKVEVLRGHCEDVGRDLAGVEVTHLSLALDASVEEHIGRYRALAEAGVRTAMVRLPRLDEAAVEAFAPVIAAFAP
ncbi:MAG TPA: LLM class flavin-dependent oxidoreductase, partial [Acidimicrobiales bacterium]|nr:LLM class flavin-dependent oxidoreductase [Acidimicrobiales bacterium]